MFSGKSLNFLVNFSRRLNRSGLRKFLTDRRGAVVLLFGLTLIPIIGFVGGAIDYAYAYRTRAKMQNALDAAALAAGRVLDVSTSESDAQEAALKVMEANLGSNFPAGLTLNISISGTVVTATANVTVNTYILGALGIDTFPVGATSTVNIAGGTFEVVMVLDNSGSMAGSKISSLRTAASNLVNILFSNQQSSANVTIGLVPFAMAVNVGTQYSNASWMDQTPGSSIHSEHFSNANRSRWWVLNKMNNVSWGGCVEVRPAPHDVDDTPATGGDSNFVPLFAPDEPDSSSSYPNDYLDDSGGTCKKPPNNDTQAQRRLCKYKTATPNTSLAFGTRMGPNWGCDSNPVQELTSNSGSIVTSINAMQAYGGTNIHTALMWGWRLLSPGEPFSEGKPYNEPNNTKIMILMSDGANWALGTSTHNESWYSAYGYHAQNRLGSSSGSTAAMRATMNTRTAQSCTNAKAAGVVIYSLALEITDQTTLDMLEACATSSSRFFTLDNSNQLDDAFEAIAQEISNLRITG